MTTAQWTLIIVFVAAGFVNMGLLIWAGTRLQLRRYYLGALAQAFIVAFTGVILAVSCLDSNGKIDHTPPKFIPITDTLYKRVP